MIPAICPVGGILRQPTDIAGCEFWLDASDSATVIRDANGISAWNDKSANARHVSQSTNSLKPSYSGTQNGKNVIAFNTTLLSRTSNFPFIGASGWTIFAVSNLTNYGSTSSINRIMVGNFLSTTPYGYVGVQANGATGYPQVAGTRTTNGTQQLVAGTSGVTTGSWQMWSVVSDFNTTTVTLYLNQVQALTSTAWQTPGVQQSGAGYFMVGAFPGTYSPWVGGMAELIGYAGAISTAQRVRVESYLKAKWGL